MKKIRKIIRDLGGSMQGIILDILQRIPLDHLGTGVSRRRDISHLGTGVSRRRDISHLGKEVRCPSSRHRCIKGPMDGREQEGGQKTLLNASNSPPLLVLPSPTFPVAFEHHIFPAFEDYKKIRKKNRDHAEDGFRYTKLLQYNQALS